MAHSWVADEGYSLQIWRVAVNILNKQLQTSDKGWSSSFGVRRGANNAPLKEPACYEMLHRASDDFDGFFGMI
jgi:hypothetical protein